MWVIVGNRSAHSGPTALARFEGTLEDGTTIAHSTKAF